MVRSLVVVCPVCKSAREVVDPANKSSAYVGETIQRAETAGLEIQLQRGPIKVGCECPLASSHASEATKHAGSDAVDNGSERRQHELTTSATASSQAEATGFNNPLPRFTLLQALLVVTTVALLLAIFRHPISLLFDERVGRWAVAPWSVYGWLFWGTEVIDPKPAGKTPIAIIVFAANVMAAILLPIATFAMGVQFFKRLWMLAGTANASARDLRQD